MDQNLTVHVADDDELRVEKVDRWPERQGAQHEETDIGDIIHQ